EKMDAVCRVANYEPVAIEAPFMAMDKGEILEQGLKLGLDYSKTWTCYNGREPAGGRCGSCVERLEAFAAQGSEDPLAYEAEACCIGLKRRSIPCRARGLRRAGRLRSGGSVNAICGTAGKVTARVLSVIFAIRILSVPMVRMAASSKPPRRWWLTSAAFGRMPLASPTWCVRAVSPCSSWMSR